MKKSIYLDVPVMVELDFAPIVQVSPFIAGTGVALADGFTVDVDWGSVEGMNDVRVDSAALSVTRTTDVEVTASDWTKTAIGTTAFDVTVDAPRVHALVLEGLKSGGGNELKNEGELRARGLRLVVSLPGQMPLFTAPAVEAHGVMPPSFTGATYDGGVLTLPDLAAGKVRLSLVKTAFPTEPAPQPISLSKVSGVGATVTTDLVLTESTGEVVWRIDGEMPIVSTTVDLRLLIEKTLKANAKAKPPQPLKTSFTLTGKGKAVVSLAAPTGAVIRRVPGILTTELAGEAIPLAVPPPFATDLPSRAITGVTIRYHEIRLLEQFVDAVPAQAGGIAGIVVGDAPVLRKLPPHALDECRVAKIALVGRPPVDCELVVQLVHADTGAAVTQPAAATLTASAATSLVWLDIPEHEPINMPVSVVARTNHGRFLWAASPEPLLRIAIHDPDPSELPVFIGGSDARQKTLAGAQFASKPPLVESLLFATVDVADLALEYDR